MACQEVSSGGKLLYRPPTPVPGKGWEQVTHRNWEFKARSESIAADSRVTEVIKDEIGARCPLPEMLFPDNFLEVTFKTTGFKLSFLLQDALRQWVNRTHHNLPISKEVDRKVFVNCDWTYTTDYAGSLSYDKQLVRELLKQKRMIECPGFAKIVPTSLKIPLDKLKKHDDILFYSDVVLFMDELSDHGQTTLEIKIRVMADCFLVMMRLYVRIDGRCVRLWQWRYFHEFGQPSMLTDFESREDTMENIMRSPARPFTASISAKTLQNERYFATPDAVYDAVKPNAVTYGMIIVDII